MDVGPGRARIGAKLFPGGEEAQAEGRERASQSPLRRRGQGWGWLKQVMAGWQDGHPHWGRNAKMAIDIGHPDYLTRTICFVLIFFTKHLIIFFEKHEWILNLSQCLVLPITWKKR